MSAEIQKNHIKTILVIENSGSEKTRVENLGDKGDYQVIRVATASQALLLSEQVRPDLLLLEDSPLDMSGVELYDQMHSQRGLEDTPALFLNTTLSRDAMEQRNIVCLSRPFGLNHLLLYLDTLLTFPKSTVA